MRVLLAILLLALATPCFAVPVQATATWNAPSTGSPVEHYEVQLQTDGGNFVSMPDTTATSYIFTLESGHTYSVRVAGVDAQGRQGPWSTPSDPYTPDLGAPGAPTKPIVVQN